MAIWTALKKRLLHWREWDEWVLHDVQRVHEVIEEYGSAYKVDVRYAEVYRHRETGETRVHIGSSAYGFPSTQTGKPGKTSTWGRVGSDKKLFESVDKETFIEENETYTGD